MDEISQIASQKVVVVFNGLQSPALPARIAFNMLLAIQQKEAFHKLKRKPFLREPVRETITSIIQTQGFNNNSTKILPKIKESTGLVYRDPGYSSNSSLILHRFDSLHC